MRRLFTFILALLVCDVAQAQEIDDYRLYKFDEVESQEHIIVTDTLLFYRSAHAVETSMARSPTIVSRWSILHVVDSIIPLAWQHLMA